MAQLPLVQPTTSASYESPESVVDSSPRGLLESNKNTDTSQVEIASGISPSMSNDSTPSQGSDAIISPRIDFPGPSTTLPLQEQLDIDTAGMPDSYTPAFGPGLERAQAVNMLENGTANVSAGLYALADFACARTLKVDTTSGSPVDLEEQIKPLDEGDLQYLRKKGAFDLPVPHLQEELINAFFAEVHPTVPVINRIKFLDAFYNQRMESRLLLFAVFTAGARACRNPALLDSKGTNHSAAQRFYRATKARLSQRPPCPNVKILIPIVTIIGATRHRIREEQAGMHSGLVAYHMVVGQKG